MLKEWGELGDIAARFTPELLEKRLTKERAHEARTAKLLENCEWNFYVMMDRWVPRILRWSGMLGRGKANSVKIEVTNQSFVIPNLPDAFNDYRILHLSDFHADISEDAMFALTQLLPTLSWDICLITGDFRGRTWGDWQKACKVMEPVIAAMSGPKWAILGNHDTIHLVPCLENIGLPFLLNEGTRIKRDANSIWIAGVDDPHLYKTHSVPNALNGSHEGEVKILLSHSSDTHEAAEKAGVDLLLCGHTHGGQICLPMRIPVLTSSTQPRWMAAGKWRFDKMWGYTSRGVGTSNIDARFNCPPEVAIHTLKNI